MEAFCNGSTITQPLDSFVMASGNSTQYAQEGEARVIAVLFLAAASTKKALIELVQWCKVELPFLRMFL